MQGFQPRRCHNRAGRSALALRARQDARINDLLLGFAAAAGSFGSGIIFAASGYGSLGLAAAAAALIPLGLAVWWQVRGRKKPPARV